MNLEKIDIHNSEETYQKSVATLKTDKEISEMNKKLIIDFLKDASVGKTARKGAKRRQVNVRARMKNLYLLKSVARFMQKDFDKFSVNDMEKMVRALNDNKFLSYTGKRYSEQSKSNIKKTFMQFLRWLYNDGRKARELTDWIDTSYKKREKPFLRETEVESVVRKANTLKQKILFSFLFDCGCRIEEFLNIRISDVVRVASDPPYYKVLIREEFSKTRGRNVSLFWRYSTDLIEQWLEELEDKSASAQFFPSTYDGVRVLLTKIGKRILKRHITPHMMRHSSATYYASRLNRQQLCIRYGWAFSSGMPDVYIQRAGVDDERYAEEVKKERFEELSTEIIKLKESNKALKDSDRLFAEKFMELLEVLKNNKNASKLIVKKDMEKLKELFA